MEQRIRVIVADDHPIMRIGIEEALNHYASIVCVGVASNPAELLGLLESTPCDVVVTDFAMPTGDHPDGVALLETLREKFPMTKIVVLSSLDFRTLGRALVRLGLRNIVSKTDDLQAIGTAVYAAHVGRPYLSPAIADHIRRRRRSGNQLTEREREVLLQFASGKSVGDIAKMMGRSKQAISTQKRAAMRKLGFGSDAEIYMYVADSGLGRIDANDS